jgi:hypothetical protein
MVSVLQLHDFITGEDFNVTYLKKIKSTYSRKDSGQGLSVGEQTRHALREFPFGSLRRYELEQ